MPRLLGLLRWDLVLIALILGAYRGIVTGDVIWMRDLPRWVVPSRHALRECLARGELPRWDHLQGIGIPLLANPLHGVFYPPTALSLLEPLAWWTNAFLLAHVLFGAVGFARLARRSGVSSEGAAITGVAWALSGPVLSEWTAGIRLPSLSWAPWIALGLVDLCASPRPRAVPRLALPLGLALLAGEPFMVLFGVLFAVVALPASEAWPAPSERRARLPALLVYSFVGVALGALLAAVAYSPVLGALAGTQRASTLAASEATAVPDEPPLLGPQPPRHHEALPVVDHLGAVDHRRAASCAGSGSNSTSARWAFSAGTSSSVSMRPCAESSRSMTSLAN